ncbi:MAG: hypothetical protein AAGF53_19660, partial [Pseudomonadota bacterium]
ALDQALYRAGENQLTILKEATALAEYLDARPASSWVVWDIADVAPQQSMSASRLKLPIPELGRVSYLRRI